MLMSMCNEYILIDNSSKNRIYLHIPNKKFDNFLNKEISWFEYS